MSSGGMTSTSLASVTRGPRPCAAPRPSFSSSEPRFAPRPIEAGQPEPAREDWAKLRANTWHKLARPGRIVHYAELRKLLIEHGDGLAKDIDFNAPPVLRRTPWSQIAGQVTPRWPGTIP